MLAGTSTGANVVAALPVAGRLGVGKTVATIIVDSGLRYVGTAVLRAFNEQDGRALGSTQ